MKYLAALVVFIIAFKVNCADRSDDKIVFASQSDQCMNDAIEKAKSTLDDFLQIAKAAPNDSSGFKLKVMVADTSGVEHLWFSPFKEIEGGYAGILANEPGIIQSMEYGKVYAFKRSQITDWGYVKNGKQIGSFTVCALFKTMDEEIVEQYKKLHGFVCEP